MIYKRFFCLLFLLLPNFAVSQLEDEVIKTKENSFRGCTFLVQSCQTHCKTKPNDYVQWTIDTSAELQVSCIRSDLSNFGNVLTVRNPLITTFMVNCCEESTRVSGPSGPPTYIQCLDEKKLNTLLILGVATLACILLISLFVCVGLFFFRNRNRSYKLGSCKDDSRSIAKSSEKAPSTTLTFPNSTRGNNTPSSSLNSNTPPSRYLALKATDSAEKKEHDETAYVNSQSEQGRENQTERSQQVYVDQEIMISNGPRSIIIKNEGLGSSPADNEVTGSSKVVIGSSQLSGDFEIRGGFIKPKRSSSGSNQSSARFQNSVNIKVENEKARIGTNQANAPILPEVAAVSGEQQTLEDPYVDAPPMKSIRSSTKFESPGAYQTLLTNNTSNSPESNEYNTLLHNGTIANNDIKALLFLNNNSRQQSSCKSSKCEVAMKGGPAITNSAEA